jgi:GT2 family glycosyltransferase
MIYIITPVYNRIKFTRNYLKALESQTDKNFKVIIIDDGSTDGTSEMIEKEFPNVILLKEKGNLWWAEATNIGVRYALINDAKYIMTLNDDTIPTPDYIKQMIFWSKQKPNVLLGAFALNIATNKSFYGGEKLNWKSGKFENILESVSVSKQYGLYKTNTFPGRGLLIPVVVFKEIGLYDSHNFPQTYADIDFTARANFANYEIFCNYDAKIKIYPQESGGNYLRNNKSWKNYYQHLFGMKGAGNLKWFTIFAFKNAPKKYLISYWLTGVVRRIGGYLLEWIKEKSKIK